MKCKVDNITSGGLSSVICNIEENLKAELTKTIDRMSENLDEQILGLLRLNNETFMKILLNNQANAEALKTQIHLQMIVGCILLIVIVSAVHGIKYFVKNRQSQEMKEEIDMTDQLNAAASPMTCYVRR